MEIRHAFVGIVAGHATRVGTRHERNGAPHLQLGLEGERLVAGGVGRGGPPVHQEQRHGSRPRRNPARKRRSAQWPGDHMQDQPVRARHRLLVRIVRNGKRHRDRFFTGPTLPPRRCLSLAFDHGPVGSALRPVGRLATIGRIVGPSVVPGRVLHVAVVTPPDGHIQPADALCDQKAQAHRRRKKALLGRSAVFRGIIAKTAFIRDLWLEIIVRVGIRALFRRRRTWYQKTREIPVGRTHPPRQALIRQRMPDTGTNQIQLKRFPKPGTYVSGLDHLPHVGSGTVSAGESRLAAP